MNGYKEFLCGAALQAGFSRVRVLSPFDPAALVHTPPRNYSLGAGSLLVCALPYGNCHEEAVPHCCPEMIPGEIAPFARFNYYREALKRMKGLSSLVRTLYGGKKSDYRIMCNSPVPEKPLAIACGLGAHGRNGLVISRESGSLFVIAAMTLPYSLESDPPLECPKPAEHRDGEAMRFPLCVNCTGEGRGESLTPPCVAACPSGAALGNGRINLERCIQWYASGHGAEIPAPVLAVWGKRLYGCSSCQDACVHNIRPIQGVQTNEGHLPEFIDVRALLKLSDAEIKAMFKGTAMGLSWLGPRAIRRNAEAVLQYAVRSAFPV